MKFFDEEPKLVAWDAVRRASRFPNIQVYQGPLRPDTWKWANDPSAGTRVTLVYADEPETYRIFSDEREKE